MQLALFFVSELVLEAKEMLGRVDKLLQGATGATKK